MISFQSVESRIRSRWYPANPPTLNKRPRQIGVVVRQPNPGSPKDRYVFAEGHLGHARLQPYVHDCKATVREGPHIYKYRVFFKRHCRLPLSVCLTTLLGNQGPPVLRSDVVVVRLGEEDAPVNMRDRDSIVADWLVKE